MNYNKKLKSSRWIKKRKRILKRYNYRCTVCGKNKDLEIHHSFYYEDFRDPWMYKDKYLLTLCHDCHMEYHKTCEVEIKVIAKKKKQGQKKTDNVSIADMQNISGVRVKKKDGTVIYIDL